MFGTSIKKRPGKKEIRDLFKEDYEGNDLENLVSLFYPLVGRIGYDGLERVADLSRQIADCSSNAAFSLLKSNPEIIDRLLQQGDQSLVMDVYDIGCQIACGSWIAAFNLLKKSPEIIDRLFQQGDQSLVMNVYDLGRKAAEYDVNASVCLLERSPDLIDILGYDGLEKFAQRISQFAQESKSKALSFACGESLEYVNFINDISCGLELKKVKPVLSYYLNALLGYNIKIAEGDKTSTDGEKIYLPTRIKDFTDNQKNFIMYKVLATVEEGHLEYGSFDFELARIQDVTEKINAKYGNKK